MPYYLERVIKPRSVRDQAKKRHISALTEDMAKQEPSAFTGMTENMSSLSDASVDLTEEKYYM